MVKTAIPGKLTYKISISSIKNPISDVTAQFFALYTYDGDSNPIDINIATGIGYKPLCNPYCKDCNLGDSQPSNCSSCYDDTSLPPIGNNIVYDKLTYSCGTTCSGSQYISNNMCQSCDAICQKCSLVGTNCTECYSGTYLLQNTCKAVCDDFYYPDGAKKTCEACVSPCLTCYTLTDCKTCAVGFYMDT